MPAIRWPFPAADKVKLGVGPDAITSAYGYPAAWVVSSDDGHIVETLMYSQERGGEATVIRIVDGLVAAAYTKASPASPPGSLIRNIGARN
jgi:hypothetical protein